SVLFWRSLGERRVRISVDEPKAKWAGIWFIQNTENSVATDVFIGFNRTTHRYIETKTQTLQYIGVVDESNTNTGHILRFVYTFNESNYPLTRVRLAYNIHEEPIDPRNISSPTHTFERTIKFGEAKDACNKISFLFFGTYNWWI